MAKLKKIEANLYLDEESLVYIWREFVRGRQHWQSTGETTIGLARAKVKVFRTSVTEDKPKTKARHIVGEAFDIVMAIEGANSRKSLESATTHVDGHLRRWFMGGPAVPPRYGHPAKPAQEPHCIYLDEFEKSPDENWAAYMTDQADLTPGRKLGHDRRFLVMALKRAKKKGWISRDFTKEDFKVLEFSDPVGRLVDEDELARLLPAVRASSKLFLQVMIALFHGQRLREILHLRVDEIDLKNETIRLGGKRVKTRRGREIQIHERVLPLIKEWLRSVEGDYLFPSIHSAIDGKPVDLSKPQNDNSTAWDTSRTAAGVDCRFHDLRHTAISNMLLDGIPMPAISLNSGASVKTIMRIYAHLDVVTRKKIKTFCSGKLVGWKK